MPMFLNAKSSNTPDKRSKLAMEAMPMSPTSLPSNKSCEILEPSARCSSSSKTLVNIASPVACKPQFERSKCWIGLRTKDSQPEKNTCQGAANLVGSKSASSSSIATMRAVALLMPSSALLRICAETEKSLALDESDFFFWWKAFSDSRISLSAFSSKTRCSQSVPLPKSVCARRKDTLMTGSASKNANSCRKISPSSLQLKQDKSSFA
mmetsp:Transcript_15971/g.31202  ORF Transcript_15971/g.31202 Transcript_15971/m.31202 type:complete len:209 (-) Transcript_15971:161-787(-)